MPQHRGRRRQIVVVRADRHGRSPDNHGKAGSCGLHRPLLGERLGACIGSRHGVGRQHGLFRDSVAGSLGMEQDGFGGTMQEADDAALLRGSSA